jgi:hypothetical protein
LGVGRKADAVALQIVAKLKKGKAGPDGLLQQTNLALPAKEECDSKRADLSVIMMMMMILFYLRPFLDRFCGLVVRVPGYRSRAPGSIPDATTFSEK